MQLVEDVHCFYAKWCVLKLSERLLLVNASVEIYDEDSMVALRITK